MENEIIAGNEGTAAQEVPGTNPNPGQAPQSKPEGRLFTREQVNDLMKRRVERSHNAYYSRYGVKDLNELDELFGQSRSYGPLKEKYDGLEKEHNDLLTSHKDLQKRYAYKMGNVDEKRIPDIEAYFKGKNIEIDENTLANELKSHPEWAKKAGIIQPIGAEATPGLEVDERALASKYFGVNLNKRK